MHLVKGTTACKIAKRTSERRVEQRVKPSIWFSVSLVRLKRIEAKRDELVVEFRLTCLQRRFQFSEEIKDSSLIAVWRFHQVGGEGAVKMSLPF